MNMHTRTISLSTLKWVCTRHALVGLVAIGIVIGSPLPVSGQEMDARRLDDAMPAEYAAQVREIAREAREAGVPPALIARKAFEGVAKGYPPERVVSALDAYAGRLREARDLLGPDRRLRIMHARGLPDQVIESTCVALGEGISGVAAVTRCTACRAAT